MNSDNNCLLGITPQRLKKTLNRVRRDMITPSYFICRRQKTLNFSIQIGNVFFTLLKAVDNVVIPRCL